jgi:hypothetical protein
LGHLKIGGPAGERELFHDFVDWLQHGLGKASEDGLSWSEALHGSLNLWNIVEGTHVLTLMFFAGTIWIIDLRMMGLAFKTIPFSRLNDKVLPLTIAAFGMMVVTGVVAFFGRDPLLYYHDIWFRLKMTFLVIASLNIFWFHFMVQKNQAEWDNDPSPPARVKLSGALSMSCWILIIIFGRFIAYDWYRCEKVEPGSFVYVVAECKQALSYLDAEEGEMTDEGMTEEGVVEDGAAVEGEVPAEGEAPADESPPDPAAAPAETPAQPTPGQGG